MEDHRIHKLGHRAFLLFLMRRMRSVIFFFVLAAAVWYSVRWAPPFYAPFVAYGAQLLGLFSAMYFLAIVLWTWLAYRVFTYSFADEAFIMTSGYIVRNEMAALYHQIQNVGIQRSPLDRAIGVSKIIIYMNGAERDEAHNRIVLPAVGRKKAKMVQKELLVRARRHMAGSPIAENRSAGAFGPDR